LPTEDEERLELALRAGDGLGALNQLARDLLGADGEQVLAPRTSHPLERVLYEFPE
jgi:hypothetical protein